jgi:hypothetical protein
MVFDSPRFISWGLFGSHFKAQLESFQFSGTVGGLQGGPWPATWAIEKTREKQATKTKARLINLATFSIIPPSLG